jgi:hypothetical protein
MLKSVTMKNGQTGECWRIKGIRDSDRDSKTLNVTLSLYKDAATRTAEKGASELAGTREMASYSVDLSGATKWPLDLTTLDLVDNNPYKLIYEKIVALGTVGVYLNDVDVDFTGATTI